MCECVCFINTSYFPYVFLRFVFRYKEVLSDPQVLQPAPASFIYKSWGLYLSNYSTDEAVDLDRIVDDSYLIMESCSSKG